MARETSGEIRQEQQELHPRVSILLPVFNGEEFLGESIESILRQTYSDFELIIVDDGSEDTTPDIVHEFAGKDARIVAVRNEENLGIVGSLNRGIALARGEFIARQDADDISLPARLEKQVRYLESHPDTALIATRIAPVDSERKQLDDWADDVNSTQSQEIRRFLPKANCIAHPSVLMRRNVVIKYAYDKSARHSEDYELWLRMVADKHKLEKLDEPLVLYRVHSNSVTGSTRSVEHSLMKNIRAKRVFLYKRLKKLKFGLFEAKVMAGLLADCDCVYFHSRLSRLGGKLKRWIPFRRRPSQRKALRTRNPSH